MSKYLILKEIMGVFEKVPSKYLDNEVPIAGVAEGLRYWCGRL